MLRYYEINLRNNHIKGKIIRIWTEDISIYLRDSAIVLDDIESWSFKRPREEDPRAIHYLGPLISHGPVTELLKSDQNLGVGVGIPGSSKTKHDPIATFEYVFANGSRYSCYTSEPSTTQEGLKSIRFISFDDVAEGYIANPDSIDLGVGKPKALSLFRVIVLKEYKEKNTFWLHLIHSKDKATAETWFSNTLSVEKLDAQLSPETSGTSSLLDVMISAEEALRLITGFD